MLTHQSSPTRTQRPPQRKFAFTFDYTGQKQAGEIRCRDQQNAQRRNYDDKVYSDVIVLKRDDGELTTVTIDEFSELKKLPA